MSGTGALRPEDVGIGKLFWRVVDAVVVADVATGRIVLWNPSAERIFGYREAEVVGRRIEDVLVPLELRAAHLAGLEHYRATGRGRLIDAAAPVEVPAVRADGSHIPIELTLSPIDDTRGVGRYVLALIRDARGRKEAEEQRARLVAAERAAEARDQVVGAIGHDLRAPLTAIKGTAQLARRRLTRGEPDLAQLAAAFEQIEASAARMDAMLAELGDSFRLEAGRPLELQRQAADLVALTRRAVAEASASAPGRVIRVEASAAELVGEWDPERLGRILDNLLGNAVKYSPAETEVVARVGVDPADDGWTILEVEDRGIGIPAQDLPRVFEPFYRATNVTGRVAGTGIGLSGSRAVVEQHGGTIAVDSREGSGTTVRVRLPRHA